MIQQDYNNRDVDFSRIHAIHPTLLDKCPIGWRFPPIDLIQPSLQFIE
jgi:hypothetical protein